MDLSNGAQNTLIQYGLCKRHTRMPVGSILQQSQLHTGERQRFVSLGGYIVPQLRSEEWKKFSLSRGVKKKKLQQRHIYLPLTRSINDCRNPTETENT
jgi:hypothetical protein